MAAQRPNGDGPTPPSEAHRASDVLVFGQQIGRVLSDGQIVGRAEPFAKVFPSSREVKRAVGLLAWGILEDIALDASIDLQGRLVADTSARRICAHLGLSRNTVQKHLQTLRTFGFVLHEELRHDGTGRYEVSRYVINPAACIERFTATPTLASDNLPATPHREVANPPEATLNGVVEGGVEVASPAPAAATKGDSRGTPRGAGNGASTVAQKVGHGPVAVAQSTGTRELRQKELRDVDVAVEENITTSAREELTGRLRSAGVTATVAGNLVATHMPARIDDALDALELHHPANPAGWVVRAIADHWDLTEDAAAVRARWARAAAEQRAEHDRVARAEVAAAVAQRSDGWARAISAALTDAQLSAAIARHTVAMPGVDRRSAGLTHAQLLAWAICSAQRNPDLPFADALISELDTPCTDPPGVSLTDAALPGPPPTTGDKAAADLMTRIRCQLPHLQQPAVADLALR